MFCGMDLGSRAVKIVLHDGQKVREEKIVETARFYKTCGKHSNAGFAVDFGALLTETPTSVTVTGYGRNSGELCRYSTEEAISKQRDEEY